eukprot:GGOE01045574.1.p1 GENE.GGOE01045574.1~~GGOE01045574.1.p1  ORF type:complete len:290 (+),score=42.53 GGOE01045574.1:64-933(+)
MIQRVFQWLCFLVFLHAVFPDDSSQCGLLEDWDCTDDPGACGVTYIMLGFLHGFHRTRRNAASLQRAAEHLRSMQTFDGVKSLVYHHPNLSNIALITDQNWSLPIMGLFQHIIWIEQPKSLPATKAQFLALSPWRRTLFLDMDTYVVQPLPLVALLDLLRFYDLLAAPEPLWDATYRTKWLGLGTEGELQYNSGVLLHRTSPCMLAVFERWEAIWQHETSCDYRSPWDQCALYRAIRRTEGLKVGTLSAGFNCKEEPYDPPSIYILHSTRGLCFQRWVAVHGPINNSKV